ncbi:hypothetical protein ABFX02_12G152200 [Erythranthe guttata]
MIAPTTSAHPSLNNALRNSPPSYCYCIIAPIGLPYSKMNLIQNERKIPDKDERVVTYEECRKNHAASIGKYAVDGCCEFMPAGEVGSSAALRCAACSCHRNFHKKVVR